jgi:hypothetical protein
MTPAQEQMALDAVRGTLNLHPEPNALGAARIRIHSRARAARVFALAFYAGFGIPTATFSSSLLTSSTGPASPSPLVCTEFRSLLRIRAACRPIEIQLSLSLLPSMQVRKQHGAIQVRAKSDRKSPMMTAAPTAEFTRSAAGLLVERAERQTGSRMTAYANVAQNLGTSASWLRKFLAGREAKEPGWTVGWKILDQYSRMCSRVEAEIEMDRARTLALKERVDALTATANRMVEGPSSKTTA